MLNNRIVKIIIAIAIVLGGYLGIDSNCNKADKPEVPAKEEPAKKVK